MVYDLSLAPVPVRVRALRGFEARDPWDGERLKRWSVSLFKLVPEQVAVSAEWAQIRPSKPLPPDPDPVPGGRSLRPQEVLGLEVDGAYRRLLPRVLQEAWSRGAVPDTGLPALLATLEPELKRRDFGASLGARRVRALVAIILGALSATILLLVLVSGGLGSDRALVPVLAAFPLVVLGGIALFWRVSALRQRRLIACIEELASTMTREGVRP